MKIDPATCRFATDSMSTYESPWFGDKGRDKPKQLGGDGGSSSASMARPGRTATISGW